MAPSPPPESALRVVYMGTSDFACPALQTLAAQPNLRIAAVITQPDRPGGRKLKPQPPPVKTLALQLGLPLHQPPKARDPDFLQTLREGAPDLIVVASYGQLLPQALLDIPRHGCLNIHASLLPRHRGAAPIQWAILLGDAETGVTIMRMDAGLDTGPMVTCERTPIEETETAAELHDRLAILGGRLLVDCLPGYLAGHLPPVPQPEEGATYARKIRREDGAIDWTQAATRIARQGRALTPWPGTYTHWHHQDQRRLLKIWKSRAVPGDAAGLPGTLHLPGPGRAQVICGQGLLELDELQTEGGKRLPTATFLMGHAWRTGERLG